MNRSLPFLGSVLALLIVAFSFMHLVGNFSTVDFNNRGIVFNTAGKVPMKDRMDLAWEQERELTMDPATGEVPKERLLEAWKYQQTLLQKGSLGKAAIPGVTWTERGPNNCGGRSRSMLVDLNDPTRKTIWVGSVAGGLWKTSDITVVSPAWVCIDNFFPNMAISHIDQAPNKPQVMYFCTGEGNSNSDAVRGLGVWKSIDAGATWNQLTATNNSSYYYCQKIVSIGNGDTVLVLTKSGLFRSSNGGTSFTKVLGTGMAGALGNLAYDLEVMKNGTFYVTMSDGNSNGGTIHKSYNTGVTWTNPLTLPTYVNKDEMEIAVSGTDTNYVYVLVESASRIRAILKSTNAGISFDTTAAHPRDADGGVSTTAFPKDFSRNQAWYDLSLAVDPLNRDVVIVGGIDLFRTRNGGGTWTQISHWYGGFGFQEVHADQHYAIFAPNDSNVVYFTNDGGIYRCTNFSATNPTIITKENNYNTAQFYACDISPNAGSHDFIAGAQDNGSHRYSVSGIGNTVEVTGGDGAFCHIDQDQSNYWFTSYVYTSYYRSTNGGSSFSNALTTSGNVGSFINPCDYDDTNNRMYLCGNNGTYTRWNNPQSGNSLTYDTVPVFNNGKITHVKISPNVNNRVYFGLNNGFIVRVDNAHQTLSIDSVLNRNKMVNGASVSCIEIEDGNENHILATLSNYGVISVWESKDGGWTWTNSEGNLPDMPVRWALFNPNKTWQAMIATELGVWSTDSLRGTTTNWQPSNTGFSNVRTDMLKMRGFDRQVIAATHGRGLFSTNVFSPPFADFSVNKTISYVSAPLNFTSTSNGATSYYWDFGDGTNSTLQNPVKQYFTPGFYTVSLFINGGMYSKTYNSLVQVLPYRATPYTPANGGDFEANPGDFGAQTVSGVGFQRGNSTVSGKNGTVSGSNAWVTGLTGNYANNNEALLYTPCFNFTATGTYTIRFYVKNNFEIAYDGYILEYSTNLGNTWTKLGTSVQTNWYDFGNTASATAFPQNQPYFNATNSSYTQKSYATTALTGNSKVCFRFVFKSDVGVTAPGMAIDNFDITGPNNAALPVTFTDFNGRRISDSQVDLMWSTASERNNKGFQVERSTDGFHFSPLGFVAGSGRSANSRWYRFSDEQAPQDQLYYRIKQEDLDGIFSYSKTIRIQDKPEKDRLVNFSLLDGSSNLFVQNLQLENIHLRIMNQNGQLVFSGELNNSDGVFDLSELANGIYLVAFHNREGKVQTDKLLLLGNR